MEIQQICKNHTFNQCHVEVSHKNNFNQFKEAGVKTFLYLASGIYKHGNNEKDG